MNLVIIDVLPTPWSPKNTNLYFASGEMFAFAGVPEGDSMDLSPPVGVTGFVDII